MDFLKKTALSFFVLIGILLSTNPIFASSGYNIKNYDVEIIVGEDNVLSITEKIDVNFTNSRKHGIKRNIPTISTAVREKNGKQYKKTHIIKVDNVNVNNEYEIERGFSKTTIKIGDPDKYASENEQYIIRYTYAIGDDGIAEFDDLYYNIVGTEWDTYIENTSFKIIMPKDFDENLIYFSSGSYGNTDSSVTYRTKNNVISGKVNHYLKASEGVTIRVELPEGYFDVPAGGSNKVSTIIIIGLCLLFAIFCTAIFMQYGRDDIIYETIEFYPPEGMTPSEVGYIAEGKATSKQIIALIVYWASKGFLRIKQLSEENFEFEKITELNDDAKLFEKIVFGGLFSGRNSVSLASLKYTFNTYIEEARKLLISEFATGEKKLSNQTSTNWQIGLSTIAIILNFLVYSYIIYTTFAFFNDILFVLVVSSIMTLIISAYFIMMVVTINKSHHTMSASRKIILGILTIIFLILSIIIAILFSSFGASLLAIVVLTLVTIYTSIIVGLTYKRSNYCTKMLGQILGFKDFLEKAEKDRFETLVNENPAYFYDIMPYTYLLGISERWMKKFEGINMSEPEWYVPYGHYTFGDYIFYHMMFSNMDRMNENLTAVELDDSFGNGGSGGFFGGGGGFSGGGFGGGGGSSW